MLDETERRGGSKYRKKIWSYPVLDSILMTTYSLNDSGLADRLTSVAFEWLKEESEIDVIYTDRTNLLRARVLVLIGKLDKAETITRTCIMTSEKFKSEYYVRFQELLGIILSKQERFEETYAAYNSALFQTQELQLPDETLSLLYDCGELATRFNLELADAHYTLMLSLAKTTNCRKYMGLGFKNLYQVKVSIGTKVARQDALELLIEGLTVFGIKFVCKNSGTQREPMKEIHTTIHLGTSDSLPSLAQDQIVCDAFNSWYGSAHGVNSLILLAVHLLEDMDVSAAEHAFRLARYRFNIKYGNGSYKKCRETLL